MRCYCCKTEWEIDDDFDYPVICPFCGCDRDKPMPDDFKILRSYRLEDYLKKPEENDIRPEIVKRVSNVIRAIANDDEQAKWCLDTTIRFNNLIYLESFCKTLKDSYSISMQMLERIRRNLPAICRISYSDFDNNYRNLAKELVRNKNINIACKTYLTSAIAGNRRAVYELVELIDMYQINTGLSEDEMYNISEQLYGIYPKSDAAAYLIGMFKLYGIGCSKVEDEELRKDLINAFFSLNKGILAQAELALHHVFGEGIDENIEKGIEELYNCKQKELHGYIGIIDFKYLEEIKQSNDISHIKASLLSRILRYFYDHGFSQVFDYWADYAAERLIYNSANILDYFDIFDDDQMDIIQEIVSKQIIDNLSSLDNALDISKKIYEYADSWKDTIASIEELKTLTQFESAMSDYLEKEGDYNEALNLLLNNELIILKRTNKYLVGSSYFYFNLYAKAYEYLNGYYNECVLSEKVNPRFYSSTCRWLGYLYFIGEGCIQDENLGYALYLECFRYTSRISDLNAIGYLSYAGNYEKYDKDNNKYSCKVKENKEFAYRCFMKSLTIEENSDALYWLAVMLEKGDGIPKDIKTAVKYYKRAAELGDKEAVEWLKLRNITDQNLSTLDYRQIELMEYDEINRKEKVDAESIKQAREVLYKNQQRLVVSEEEPETVQNDVLEREANSFFSEKELKLLTELLGCCVISSSELGNAMQPVSLLVESINNKCVDLIGDVLIEEQAGKLSLIEDYIDDCRRIINGDE